MNPDWTLRELFVSSESMLMVADFTTGDRYSASAPDDVTSF